MPGAGGRRDQPPAGGARPRRDAATACRATASTSLFFAADGVGRRGQPPAASPTRDLSGLRKALLRRVDHARARCCSGCAARLPDVGFYNCFGQSEIGPLATVLRPEEHAARPDSVGRPVLFVETRVVDAEMNDVAAGEVGEVVYRSPQLCTRLLGQARGDRGGVPRRLVPLRRPGAGSTTRATCSSSTASRTSSTPAACWSPPARSRTRCTRTRPWPRSRSSGCPHERWIEAIAAVVVPAEPVDAGGADRVRARAPGRAQGAEVGPLRRRAAQERRRASCSSASCAISSALRPPGPVVTEPLRALVTGAARPGGIGDAIATRMRDDGLDVITLDRDRGAVHRRVTADELPDLHDMTCSSPTQGCRRSSAPLTRSDSSAGARTSR